MDELVEFLRARLDEDEAVALSDPEPNYGEVIMGTPRVLADVEAKRRIITEWERWVQQRPRLTAEGQRTADVAIEAYEVAIGHLAGAYDKHPDWGEGWRP